MSDVVIASLIGAGGVLIGSVITLLGLGLQSYLQSKREQKQHLYVKKEELYVKIYDMLMEVDGNYRKNNWTDKGFKGRYNFIQSNIALFASKKIYAEYYKLLNTIQNSYDKKQKSSDRMNVSMHNADKIEAFAKQLREELGIKGDL